MAWQVLIAISIVFFSVGVLFQRLLLKDNKSDPYSYSVFFQIATGIMIAVFGFAFSDMSLPNLKPLIPNLIIMTVFYTLGNIFIFKALKKVEASKYSVIFSSRVFFTFLASSIILSERLGGKELLGVLFLMLGIIMVTIKSAKDIFSFKKEELIALLGAMFIGLEATNDRFVLQGFNLFPYVALTFILPAFFMLILKPGTIKKIGYLSKKTVFLKMAILVFLFTVSSLTFFGALKMSANSSQVVMVSLTSVVITVFLSIIFLKERRYVLRKFAGSVICFFALLLLTS